MSGAAVRPDIEREFKKAKRVARAYLRECGVLPPEGKNKQEHEKEKRWCDERNMRAAILGGSSPYGLPVDPDAYNATDLGRRYLHDGRDDEDLERVNKRRSRRRGNADARRPLTEDELVELIRGLSTGVSAGSHMISPPIGYDWKVPPSFPNLHWMSGEATKDSDDRTYSICDAVAEVSQEELPRRGRSEERDRPWIRTVERAWREHRSWVLPHTK